ncbi:MAG TPA: amino acid permease [Solirubrobacteraceae bacterium]|nr:amino acid permease [Solirubrobacteraceae bacterium]
MAISEKPVEAHDDDDSRRLAELGYKQDLQRGWSSFSNFAISFTIISVLAGCFTTYGQAWNNGGPIAISWGWPIICGLILLVAFSMSELASKFPTAGGIYYWASTLGGPRWGWFTGWFNLVGLVGVVASVDYAAATFLYATVNLFGVDLGVIDFSDGSGILGETFALFVFILLLHAAINIFSSPLVALFNNISVGWHVLGVAVIIGILVFVPDQHQSVDFVFTETFNNSGFSDGMFWFYVLPLGFLLTMYTQTGYDASAHLSEETKGASMSAARGVWRSVFWSGLIGWFVLLAITFAASDVDAVNEGAGSSLAVFGSALTPAANKAVVLIATIGQLFCGMACVTSCSRMMYAFSRDRAVPGHRVWTRLNHHRVPAYAVLGSCAAALIITLPALEGDDAAFPYAFFAVVSICVIGLYIAYVIPTFLRWRMGDAFEPGPWTLGRKYKWINPAAIIWVAFCVVVFCLPFTPAGVPGREEFDWKYVNYAPITVGVVLLVVGVWWLVSARHTFTGPVRNISFDDAAGVVEEKPAET